jgi:hypothetical protein
VSGIDAQANLGAEVILRAAIILLVAAIYASRTGRARLGLMLVIPGAILAAFALVWTVFVPILAVAAIGLSLWGLFRRAD